MKYKVKIIIYLILLFMIPIFCDSCSQVSNVSSETSVATFENVYETTEPGTFKMSYEAFDGSEIKTFNVNKGDRVTFNFNSSTKEGVLSIVINDPYGTALANLPMNKRGSLKIVAKGAGKISMIVTGKNTSGFFEILWK